MRKARENHWRIPDPERQPVVRRDQLIRKITLALVTETGACTDPRQPAGIDPYDSSLRTRGGDVWGLRRRA
jgi:hypothetical protein